MRSKPLLLALALCVLAGSFSLPAHARRAFSAGMYHSFKGFGLCASAQRSEADYHSFLVYADITGLPFNRYDDKQCGVKLAYSHPHILWRRTGDGIPLRFYLGPGVSAGWVRDLGQGRFGICTALNCCAGMRLDYRKSLRLHIESCAELGMHIKPRGQGLSNEISLYMNGLVQTILPQIRIEYAF